MIGTQASAEVVEQVIRQGKPYSGTADILGKSAQTYYVPIMDESGAVIGMWFVGVYTNVVSEKIDNAMIFIILLAGVLLVVGVVVSYLLGNAIAKGIKLIQDRLQLMEEGKFNFQFEDKLLNRKDEVGAIARSSNNMQKKIAEIMRNIQLESENVKGISSQTFKRMEEFKRNSNPVEIFFDDMVVENKEGEINSKELYALYTKFCNDEGIKDITNNINFGKDVKKKFPSSEKKKLTRGGNRENYYLGIELSY